MHKDHTNVYNITSVLNNRQQERRSIKSTLYIYVVYTHTYIQKNLNPKGDALIQEIVSILSVHDMI